MPNNLQQLRTYLTEHNYDRESLKQIDTWELELSKAIAAEKLHEHLVIKELVEGFETELLWVNTQLSENRQLTERQRDDLFNRKELYQNVIALFRGTKRESIEQNINNAYHETTYK